MPRELEELVLRCLAKDPLERPADAGEIRSLLGAIPGRWAIGVPQTIPAPPPGRQKSIEDTASLLRRETWMRDVLLRADALVVPSVTLAKSISGLGISPRRIAGERVIFHGRFDHDALGTIHGALDVLVVPSIWQEAYGLTVREAHLAGTPVVGSDIAGIAEGIEHDVSGLLFETGNPEALRRILERFLEDPELGPRLASGAPPIKTDADEAEEWEWRYRQVVSCRGPVQRISGASDS
jgi:glycosyltransferase involved in cell wall biosynthesis